MSVLMLSLKEGNFKMVQNEIKMKIDWFDRIAKCLKKRIVANVWSDGDEILCKSEN